MRLDWNVLERNPLLREKKYTAEVVVTGVDSTSRHVETPLRTLVTSAASDRSDVLIWMQWTRNFFPASFFFQLDYFSLSLSRLSFFPLPSSSFFFLLLFYYFEVRFFLKDGFKKEDRITMAVNRSICTTDLWIFERNWIELISCYYLIDVYKVTQCVHNDDRPVKSYFFPL